MGGVYFEQYAALECLGCCLPCASGTHLSGRCHSRIHAGAETKEIAELDRAQVDHLIRSMQG